MTFGPPWWHAHGKHTWSKLPGWRTRPRGVGRLFAEVSVTARPFFERHGFAVLAEQEVVVRGVALTN